MTRRRVFVSYSHADSALVRPVVEILRASDALVFLDTADIRAGTQWRDELEAALRDAQIVAVFWCRHARASLEVTREFLAAIDDGKDVMPILFDDTPLPDRLARYQYVDFRATVGTHDAIDRTNPRASRKALAPWFAGGIAVVGASLVATVALLWRNAPEATGSVEPVPRPTLPPNDRAASTEWLAAAVLVALLVLVAWAVVRHRRQRRIHEAGSEAMCAAPARSTRTDGVRVPPGLAGDAPYPLEPVSGRSGQHVDVDESERDLDKAHVIAARIEAEILRRCV